MSLGRLGTISMEIEMEKDVDAFVARGVSQTMLIEMDTNGEALVSSGRGIGVSHISRDRSVVSPISGYRGAISTIFADSDFVV